MATCRGSNGGGEPGAKKAIMACGCEVELYAEAAVARPCDAHDADCDAFVAAQLERGGLA